MVLVPMSIKPRTQARSIKYRPFVIHGAKVDGSNVIQFDGVSRPCSAIGSNNINNFYNLSRDWTNTYFLWW
jgi:hypothetical protein